MLHLVRQISVEFGKSVVFSTHILPDVEAVCGSALVLERGRVVASGPIATLTRGRDRKHRLAIEPMSAEHERDLAAALGTHGRVEQRGGGRFELWLAEGTSTRPVFATVAAHGAQVRSFEPHRNSLEDVFLRVVTGVSSASPAPGGDSP
jgi:ABC-2 type transport system ATP-binding protein